MSEHQRCYVPVLPPRDGDSNKIKQIAHCCLQQDGRNSCGSIASVPRWPAGVLAEQMLSPVHCLEQALQVEVDCAFLLGLVGLRAPGLLR